MEPKFTVLMVVLLMVPRLGLTYELTAMLCPQVTNVKLSEESFNTYDVNVSFPAPKAVNGTWFAEMYLPAMKCYLRSDCSDVTIESLDNGITMAMNGPWIEVRHTAPQYIRRGDIVSFRFKITWTGPTWLTVGVARIEWVYVTICDDIYPALGVHPNAICYLYTGSRYSRRSHGTQ